ncbi:MAG: KilA-N domain-containing protein [Bacilli bacterium]|nr:KilA-N domain-containing protein [Bacilli bacterium]
MKKDVITAEIIVKENKIGILRVRDVDYISLTDLAKYQNLEDPSGVIRNWMSNRNSFNYYGLWEQINNETFNSVEFHRIKTEEVPYNRFTMTPKRWKEKFNAIGIVPSAGKYSIGTFAHPDIAFEFASWLSPEFKLYLIKEFERLKKNEAYQEKIDWKANRILSKLNYVVHTDAIKEYIVPKITEKQIKYIYADEADVLNVSLFGMTAKEWRDTNPELAKKGNIRDYTDLLHLVILNNLQNTNAELIENNVSQSERLIRLNNSARRQMRVLQNNRNIAELEKLQEQVKNKKYLVE